MHNAFYASGFLYHGPSQQILLQHEQKDSQSSGHSLSLFCGKSESAESVKDAFKRVLTKRLDIHIPHTAIHDIYDYFHKELGEHYYMLFAEIQKPALQLALAEDDTLDWFPLKQLHKLHVSDQTRQDIVVGQRVINMIERERQEQPVETLSRR